MVNQAEGLQITVIGLGVVFGVLALLCGVMLLLNAVFRRPEIEDTREVKPKPPAEPEPDFVEESLLPAKPESAEVSPQVMAAITAAVCAVFGHVPGEITIRPSPARRHERKVAAMAAAVFSHSGNTPRDITIRKVEGRY